MKQTRDRVDSVQADSREDRRTVTDLKNQLERLTEKMTDMEDRCRRNNVRLVGLPEGMEGPDAAGFLRANLSKWIPSLRGRDTAPVLLIDCFSLFLSVVLLYC